MKLKHKYFLFGAGVLLVALTIRSIFFYQHLQQPLVLSDTYIINVGNGSNFTQLSRELEEKGILQSASDLLLYVRVKNIANQMRAGEYAVTPGTTALGLLQMLIRGDVKHYDVRLGEGWTLQQAIKALQEHPAISAILNPDDPESVKAAFGIEFYPEGLFFPDTYSFTRGTTDLEILKRSWNLMQQTLDLAWTNRADGLPLNSPREALILASIVEKETALVTEYSKIAGVFVLRMRKNMRLQTDPTVIYGLGSSFDGNLTKVQLQTDSPWNTYTRDGLPPTPIALPSQAAITASMHPEVLDLLYFVARGDGSHQFSSTLDQHNLAVQQYQLNTTIQ